jgi:hypothetical protein
MYLFDKKKVKLFFTVFFRVLKTAVLSRVRVGGGGTSFDACLLRKRPKAVIFCPGPLWRSVCRSFSIVLDLLSPAPPLPYYHLSDHNIPYLQITNSIIMSVGAFTPCSDSFPTPDVFKNGDEPLDNNYRALQAGWTDDD